MADDVRWLPARQPVDPAALPRDHVPPEYLAEPTVTRVEGAVLTGVRAGPIATGAPPRRWFIGAVHDDDGVLVRASQRLLAASEVADDAAVPSDRRRVRVPDRPADPPFPGPWVYAGTWRARTPDFVVETLGTLWPDRAQHPGVTGVVAHSHLERASDTPVQRRLLELAGWGDVRVRVLGRGANLRADDLLVPTRGVAVGAWALPQARAVWERVAAAVPASGVRRLYVGEPDKVATAFRRAGFEVTTPGELAALDADALVGLVGGLDVLATAGAELLLGALMPTGSGIVALGPGGAAHGTAVAAAAAAGHRWCALGEPSPRDLGRALGVLLG